MCQLAITGTLFRQKDKYKTTWKHPRSKHWHKLDHVLVRQGDIQDVHSTRVMRGAECWTDHRLVRSKLSLRIQAQKRARGESAVRKLDINRLKDPVVSANFNKSMDVALEQMRCLANPGDDANQKWVCLRDAVHATAANTLRYKKRHNQD